MEIDPKIHHPAGGFSFKGTNVGSFAHEGMTLINHPLYFPLRGPTCINFKHQPSLRVGDPPPSAPSHHRSGPSARRPCSCPGNDPPGRPTENRSARLLLARFLYFTLGINSWNQNGTGLSGHVPRWGQYPVFPQNNTTTLRLLRWRENVPTKNQGVAGSLGRRFVSFRESSWRFGNEPFGMPFRETTRDGW